MSHMHFVHIHLQKVMSEDCGVKMKRIWLVELLWRAGSEVLRCNAVVFSWAQ
jgi:hypothetical protein